MADEEVVILEPPGENTNLQESQRELNEDVSNNDEANSEEELVSIDELKVDGDSEEKKEAEDEQPKQTFDKKKIFILAGVIFFIILLAIIIILLIPNKKNTNTISTTNLANKIEKNYKTQDFEASKIDDMINKANQLYERGNRFEALKIYEKVATHNQSLSNYNLGVSQMKQGKYKEAIDSFSKAIQNKENTTVSALNAAVCSLENKNYKNFNYYIDLSNSFLQNEVDSPLYSYYYALVNYYKGNYIEALHALSHPSSKDYKDKYNYLSGKILTMMGRTQEAIFKLEAQQEFDVNFTLAQLYSQIAKFTKARDYLQKASKSSTNPDLIKMTAAIIDLKTGYYNDASMFLNSVYKINPELPNKIYKIKAVLNPELFDIDLAQIHFKDDMFFDKTKRYETIFYFAPYKVFNAKQTMSQIRKGGISVFLDDTSGANFYLKTSTTISKVNTKLSNTIAKALNYELRDANSELIKLVQIYPKHSILHYNLALTYAQLGNFSLASKHFVKSYHLDPTNYLAGVFYVLCTDITNTTNTKFIAEINENMQNDKSLKDPNIYSSLLDMVNQNHASMMRYLQSDKKATTLNLAFDIISAKLNAQDKILKNKTKELLEMIPNDIVANILDFISNNENKDIKEFAKNIQIYFKNKNLNKTSFFYGASIIKKQYIKLLQISGLLYYERDKLIKKLQDAPDNANLLQALAYIQIFTNDFQSSFDIYNRLIDEFKVQDSVNLFLASVAAIGANKPSNAIALLELAKLTDPSSIETKVALGLLYHQINNIEAASIHYSKAGNNTRKNDFYDFKLVR